MDIGKFRRYSEELQGILGNFGDIKKNYRGYLEISEIFRRITGDIGKFRRNLDNYRDIGKFRRYSEEQQEILGNLRDF